MKTRSYRRVSIRVERRPPGEPSKERWFTTYNGGSAFLIMLFALVVAASGAFLTGAFFFFCGLFFALIVYRKYGNGSG